MSIDFSRVRGALQGFRFGEVFVEHLNWSHPSSAKPVHFRTQHGDYTRTAIAELAGALVFEVHADDGNVPDSARRAAVHKAVAQHHHEHLLIFVDERRCQSLWSWLKRDDGREHPRTHLFVKGQPGDLFLSKLDALMFEMADFDTEERAPPIVEVSRRLRAALDVEAVTKRFYADFKTQHLEFLELIRGIRDRRKRRWYASVLLNRLMFIYFLQRKGFLDGGDKNYLRARLERSRAEGPDRYYQGFLQTLFFEGFANPEAARPDAVRETIGQVCYLNGGLFLRHAIEQEYEHIAVPDRAFENLLDLFDRYSWNLNDTPGGNDNEINPDVLGYIFEKYINQSDDEQSRAEKDIHQKSSGAYYTRPEITAYLCEQTIHRRVLDLVNEDDIPGVPGSGPGGAPLRFDTVTDLLLNADARLCSKLLHQILPSFKVLDPACGSGAFLVAAMKTLLDLYGAITGRADILEDAKLRDVVRAWRQSGNKNLAYFLKKLVITGNLFGVDLMEEATEIAKLRLFLALVASAATVEELEPLPNVDFNIMAGNSLVGLLHVDDRKFARKGQILLGMKSYRERVLQKNQLVRLYRETKKHGDELAELRDVITTTRKEARAELDGLLMEEFVELGIKHQQPTWDEAKGSEGKAVTRPLRATDIQRLNPFHWGYEFDEVLNDPARGGFDVVLANPPWEIFKPNAREFFQEHSELVSKSNMRLEDFDAEKKKILSKNKDLLREWLAYLARFPHLNEFFRTAPQYRNQLSIIDGKKAVSDINLYKLFLEQCFNLARPGGQIGVVVPSSIYTDLGAQQLRVMLFNENALHSLFGLSNERYLFDGVHHSFRICVLAATRGTTTTSFEAAFRVNPREAIDVAHLGGFLRDPRQHLRLTPSLVRKTSPDSLSVLEFKNELDVRVVERMTQFPLLGDTVVGTWNFELCREFHMKDDFALFDTKPGAKRTPLYEGKGIHQFNLHFAEPRYWIDVRGARARLLELRLKRLAAAAELVGVPPPEVDLTIEPDHFLAGFRKFARNTDERTLISTVVPAGAMVSESFTVHRPMRDVFANGAHQEESCLTHAEVLYVVAVLNSFVADWMIRMRVSATVNMFYVYQLPMPRLTATDAAFAPIVERAAKLTCTTAAFDDLARAVGLRDHRDGVTDPEQRLRLRAELDGLIAHLYGLSEAEFQHVLKTFPVVSESQRQAAHNAYRDVARGQLP